MPTYYLLKSGAAGEARHQVRRNSRCRPAISPCSRWWRARSTWAPMPGQSFIIGHDKGGLVAIAHDRICRQDRADRDPARTSTSPRSSELKGQKVANQTGSSVGNIFVDIIAPNAGLKKGDFQEVRMNVNDMVAAHGGQDRRRHGQRRALQRDRGGRRASAPRSWISPSVDRMPVFMAATPDFVDKNPDTVVAYLKAWQEVARDFKDNPGKVADVIYSFFTSKGYTHVARHLRQGAGARRGQSRASRPTCSRNCRRTPRCCCGRRRSPPSRTGRRRCGRTSGPRPARRAPAIAHRIDAGRRSRRLALWSPVASIALALSRAPTRGRPLPTVASSRFATIAGNR